MRQAIETKYLGPTDHRGARVMVKAAAGRMYIPWDHELDADQNHRVAAKKFASALGWYEGESGLWAGGGKANGGGNVYVWVSKEQWSNDQ